ncbi:hypothetical protein [Streptomyces sp. NPDC002172]
MGAPQTAAETGATLCRQCRGKPRPVAFTGARRDVELTEPRTPRKIVDRAVARGEIPPDSPTAARLPHFLDTVILPVLAST